jgi:hypothetical protein
MQSEFASGTRQAGIKKLTVGPFRLEVQDGVQVVLTGAASPANLFGNEWAIMVLFRRLGR